MTHRRVAERSAHILGEASAAAKALAELQRREKLGENVDIFLAGNCWIVGPPFPDLKDPPK